MNPKLLYTANNEAGDQRGGDQPVVMMSSSRAPAASFSLRQMLREKTARLHQVVDAHPTLRALSADEPSAAEVYVALCVMAHAYERIEHILAASPAFLADLVQPIPPWTKTLRDDRLRLAEWESHPDTIDLSPPRLPVGHAEWLGYLYVVLGSSLGAGNIAKRLAAHGAAAVRELQFFRLNAAHASRFGQLIAHLDRLPGEASANGLVAGAELGFDDFIGAADAISLRHHGDRFDEHVEPRSAAVSP